MKKQVPQRAIMILSYGDLFEFKPLFQGQTPVGRNNAIGYQVPIYSTGRLEWAKRNYAVWVVTQKAEFDASDTWWTSLIHEDRIIKGIDPYDLRRLGQEYNATFQMLYPWIRLYERLGVEWLNDMETVSDAKDYLANEIDAAFGEDFSPCPVK
jgi:hypothetical protein